jgi:hypothetical protein
MSSNSELLKKADIALSDLASNGGVLLAEQADTFLRVLMNSPTILRASRFVTMNSPQRKINKLGFGSRILRAAVSSTALDAADRVKPDQSQIQLNTKEVIAEVHIPYDVLEDNIERGNINAPMGASAGGLQNTLVQMIAERAALDLEELALLGDTSSGDSYLALTDGWLKKANAHVVDAGNTSISKTVFKEAMKQMPTAYLRNMPDINHFVSPANSIEYRDILANRGTAAGDGFLQGNGQIFAFGSPVVSSATMPGTTSLYTNPLNLIFGIQREITIEYDKDIRARTFIVVLTSRVDVQVEMAIATVKTINLAG